MAVIVQSDKATEVYQNANFAMFRVAIPYLRYGENGVNQIAPWRRSRPSQVIAGLDIQTVRDYAFEPTGFVEAGCVASDAAPTILYPFPSGGLPGRQPDDWIVRCGSGGWYMSSVELVGVMAFRRYTNLVMSPAARQLMDNSFLGWANPSTNPYASGLDGVYRVHGGDLGDDPGDPGSMPATWSSSTASRRPSSSTRRTVRTLTSATSSRPPSRARLQCRESMFASATSPESMRAEGSRSTPRH